MQSYTCRSTSSLHVCIYVIYITAMSCPKALLTLSLQKYFLRIFTWFHYIRLFIDIIYYINIHFVLSVKLCNQVDALENHFRRDRVRCASRRYIMYIMLIILSESSIILRFNFNFNLLISQSTYSRIIIKICTIIVLHKYFTKSTTFFG